jgi:hypothetical protein
MPGELPISQPRPVPIGVRTGHDLGNTPGKSRMHRKRVPAKTDMNSVKDSLNEPPTTGHLADEAFAEHPQWAEGGRRFPALREIYQACHSHAIIGGSDNKKSGRWGYCSCRESE